MVLCHVLWYGVVSYSVVGCIMEGFGVWYDVV